MKRKEDIILTACIGALIIMNIIQMSILHECREAFQKCMKIRCGENYIVFTEDNLPPKECRLEDVQ
jgi:hypothetical protein